MFFHCEIAYNFRLWWKKSKKKLFWGPCSTFFQNGRHSWRKSKKISITFLLIDLWACFFMLKPHFLGRWALVDMPCTIGHHSFTVGSPKYAPKAQNRAKMRKISYFSQSHWWRPNFFLCTYFLVPDKVLTLRNGHALYSLLSSVAP